MTKKDYIQVATILGRWKKDIPNNVYNGIEQNFADWFTDDNKLFDDDRFTSYIDKIAKEWAI